MSEAHFDALRSTGHYPPKGWGWKDAASQRASLHRHFNSVGAKIEFWMVEEADRLGVPVPPASRREYETELSFARSWLG